MWFAETETDRIGRISVSAPAGVYSFANLPEEAGTAAGSHGSSFYITTGSDGALWFTRTNTYGNQAYVDRITTSGTITENTVATLNAFGLTAGPDGALWYSGFQGVPEDLDIGRVPTDGSTPSYFPDSKGGDQNGTIATGSDGALWYTDSFPNVSAGGTVNIGRVTTSGVQSSYPTGVTVPVAIVPGPDSALWFTGYISGDAEFTNNISRISTSGAITNYPLPVSVNSSGLTNSNGVLDTDDGLVTGPDGALWFTDPEANSIGRITTSGTVTEYPIPTSQSDPAFIAVGPDGALWFSERDADAIGRVTTAGTFAEYPLLCSPPYVNTKARHGRLFTRVRR